MTGRFGAAALAALMVCSSAAAAADVVEPILTSTLAGPFSVRYREGHLSDPIQFQLVRGVHPVVTAEIDGKSYNLLVDSGATLVTLSKSFGKSTIGELCFANGLCFETMFAALLDSAYTQDRAGAINGLIGYSLLSALAVTIDYERRELVFGKPAPKDARHVAITSPNGDTRPFVAAEIGGQRIDPILFDTGSSFVRINADTLERLGSQAKPAGGEMAYAIGGAEPSRLFAVDEICAGGVICIANEVVQLGTWQALGGTFFRHFNLTFDAPNGVVALKPNAATDFINAREKWGLQVNLADASELVQVDADSPAARAGLSMRDRLIAVDGQKISEIGYLGVHARLEVDGVRLVELSVSRNGQTRTLALIAD